MSDFVWVLKHPTTIVTKTWKADGTISAYEDGKQFTGTEHPVSNIHDLSNLLHQLENKPHSCVIRGKYKGFEHSMVVEPQDTKRGSVLRRKSVHDDVPHHWVLVDIDKYEPIDFEPLLDPVDSINEYIRAHLPGCFHDVSYHWQLSSSMGHATKGASQLRAHVWFWMAKPYNSNQLRTWARATEYKADVAVFDPIQIHYTALPIFEKGVLNPIKNRSGFYEGEWGDTVYLEISDTILAATPEGQTSMSRHQRISEVLAQDPVVALLYEKNLVKARRQDGGINIICPRSAEHSGSSGDTSTMYYPAHTGGHKNGAFICLHSHCSKVSQSLFLDALGYDDARDVFENIDEVAAEKRERGIPEAKHLCTDQANANRIVGAFKTKMMSVADRWFAWDGRRWKQDDAEVVVRAMNLSRLIHKEADVWRSKKAKSADEKQKYGKIAEQLEAWAKKSEMQGTINAALNLAKKVLSVDASFVDTHQWLLNVRNGTVDLRTGKLKPHDPDDLITRLIDIEYDPEAMCPVWEEVLLRVTREEGKDYAPIVRFMQRWFGYAMTGSTREQKFVVHWGDGSNGKSTILDTIASVMGDYAGVAAPGLLMSADRSRHPTEIAALFGRRMVTAHESGEGNALREDFIKQATGGDKLTARFMNKDFFEFEPTHKLQLLTNHKPIIKGQDSGIWRRVLLVPYITKFGDPDEVVQGFAHFVKDTKVTERLQREKPGVLAWLISGCVEWYRDGLNPPEAVLAASKDYQTEQDRVKQFVNEVCETGDDEWCYLSNGNHEGIYPAYNRWCKIGGMHPLSKPNFLQGLVRSVPRLRKDDNVKITVEGKQRKVTRLTGLSCPEYYEM